MPRFEFACSILQARPADVPAERCADAMADLLSSTSIPTEITPESVSALLGQPEPVGRGLAAALRSWPSLRRAAIVARPGRRWIRRVFWPSRARLFSWFEDASKSLGVPKMQRRVDHVLGRLWEPEDEVAADHPGTSSFAEILLAAAFLADLQAAYRWRRWFRKMHCVLLLDDADLLTSDYSMRLTFPGDVERARRPDLIRLLAAARVVAPEAPLLVVATKQDAPSPARAAALSGPGEPPQVAQRACERWLESYTVGEPESALMHVSLLAFSEQETIHYLADWTDAHNLAERTPEIAAELHQVSRGHPRALWLLTEALIAEAERTRTVPAVRTLLDQPVPERAGLPRDASSIATTLVRGFLLRFSDDDSHDRQTTRDWLTWLSAARYLDVEIIRLLVPDCDAERFMDKLARYSFVQKSSEPGCVVLNPLLRDLLHRELLSGSPKRYHDLHLDLRDHVQKRATGDSHEETLYHQLALGNVEPLVEATQAWIDNGDDFVACLESITEAPRRRPPPSIADDCEEGKQLAERLVDALWPLRSCTGTVRWTRELLDDLGEAYLKAGLSRHSAEGPYQRYRRFSRPAASRAGSRVVPPASRPEALPYPHGRLHRHRASVALAGALTVAFVAGAALFSTANFWDDRCHRKSYGLLQQHWLGTVGSDGRILHKVNGDQCVGIATGTMELTDGNRPNGTPDGAEIAALRGFIDKENREAERRAAGPDGKPLLTVAVAAILSTGEDGSKRDLSAGVNELRGAYLAQHFWNHRSDQPPLRPQPFFIRVIPVNLGERVEHAPLVADVIRDVADELSISAVTGMGQTRKETLEAVDRLGAPPPIPVVASVVSGNAFEGKQNFTRVAPSNRRQAEVGAKFAKNRFAGRKPFLVYDPFDPYSVELRNDYAELLGKSGGFQPADDMPFSVHDPSELDTIARSVCQEKQYDPLIVYTARANELPGLLKEIGSQGCLDRVVILGDDDLTQTETVGLNDLEIVHRYRDQLYFTTFGPTRDGAKNVGFLGGETTDFFDQYEIVKKVSPGAYRTGPNGHVMLAYDAVNMVAHSTRKLAMSLERPLKMPGREELTRRLAFTPKFLGAAGPVTIENSNAKAKLVVVQQVIRNPKGRLAVRYVWHE